MLGGVFYYTSSSSPDERQALDLTQPSPALGEAVANAVHQTVTDPYFAPLENLVQYLADDPGHDMITLDQMTRWTIDDKFPVCFVWDADGNKMQIDQGASPWAMEAVVTSLREAMIKDNPRGLLYIKTFEADGEKYWLGFQKVPLHSEEPNQMAGVFFSMNRYMTEHVPRLVDKMVSRQRFPLVSFQRDVPPIYNEPDGDISLRILDKEGNVYLQRGRMFDADKMIYASSQWYDNPIVCLQRGWDLQVFSSNSVPPDEPTKGRRWLNVIFASALILVSLFYWWSVRNR